MSEDSPQQLLDSILSLGLVHGDELETVRKEMADSGTLTNEQVAKKLVDQNILTDYQAQQLLAGQGEECVLAGRYHLVEKIGAGAMGTVYRAIDTKLSRTVAVKVLPEKSLGDSEAVARFEREAKALAHVSHSGIVQVFDSDKDAGRHFLVLEYVKGVNLSELLREHGPIPSTLAADYIHQAASALQHAHERGLVHRDLKPGNLLLTKDRQIKILDLGLARFLQDQIEDGTLTREGMGMGTPDYMAPEQFQNAKNADERSDVYELGCTLYHLITGEVPFPGSSLTEKFRAHEEQQPTPLEVKCPDVPAGLAMVVHKMMAKKPDNRFQTAGEAAEALAPYIAGSSMSFQLFKETTSWQGSQLRISIPQKQTRKHAGIAGIATAAVILLIGIFTNGFGLVGSRELPKGEERTRQNNSQNQDKSAPNQAEQDKNPQPDSGDPNVLTVAQDGSGQYTKINEALEHIKPGMTVQVLDDASYTEALVIDDPQRFQNVTLEAKGKATIVIPDDAPQGIMIRNVSGFRLQGFRLRETVAKNLRPFIVISGQTAGVILKGLDTQAQGTAFGIMIGSVRISPGEAPLIIEECIIRGGTRGIDIVDSTGVCVRNNFVVGCAEGIEIKGTITHTQIAGNAVWNCNTAFDIDELKTQSEGVLIANNTLYNSHVLIRVWDDAPYEEYVSGQLEFRNNLLFGASSADMVLLHSPAEKGNPMPADGAPLVKLWDFQENWRDLSGVYAKDGLPLAPGDHQIDKLELVSRVETHPDYLRPAAGSPLATGGVGGDLPTYVGAVPPKDVEAWDWQKTWNIRYPKILLTVSKDPKDGGEFRTINEALDNVKPGMTIRVLDDAVYAESLKIDQPDQHKGILLEAPRNATLELTARLSSSVLIKDVANVRIEGFRFRDSGPRQGAPFVSVLSHSPGVVLNNLDIDSTKQLIGVSLSKLTIGDDEPPVVVRNCTIRTNYDAISVIGPVGPGNPTSNICIRDNHIAGALRGILLQGLVARTHVTGNVLSNCQQSAIQVQDLVKGSKQILIANNTATESLIALLIWDDKPYNMLEDGHVEVCNNVLLGESGLNDAVFFLGVSAQGGTPSGEKGKSLIERWDFHHNWRDLSGTGASVSLPLAPKDKKLEDFDPVSRDSQDPDFMRLKENSPLANQGAGKKDPSLPAYVGAVPPKGVEPWDWQKTWDMRVAASAESKKPVVAPKPVSEPE